MLDFYLNLNARDESLAKSFITLSINNDIILSLINKLISREWHPC
jgi:hypothetical protein